MAVYVIVMSIVAGVMMTLGVSIYRGNTSLINSYHQSRVKPDNLKMYGRSFGCCLILLGAFMIVSAAIELAGYMKESVIELFTGIIISLICLFSVQKKYNGGIF